MSRFRFLALTFLLVAVPLLEGAAAQPNILFLLADDQRADTIAAYGNPNIRTPNLDALVGRGYSFRRNYCMGSIHGAVCVPSRAMIMSGRSLYRAPTNLQGVQTLPEVLHKAGYTTFGTGKWHNQPASFVRMFDKGHAVYMGGMGNHELLTVVDLDDDKKLVNRRESTTFSSELFADAAVDFIAEYDQDNPFFAYVAFTAPHDPRQPQEEYRKPYYDANLPLPPNFKPQHPFDNSWLIGRDENLAAWPRTEAVVRDQLAEYYGLITHMDEQIGRILDALARSPHAANTIIVYAADHGLAVGSHGLIGKQSVYEHSMGAPLIFAGPGIPAGESSQTFTYLFDILPTLCDMTGVAPPQGIEGRSVAPVWRGDAYAARDSIFLAYEGGQRAIRDDRWKLIRYPHINHTQLFDLQNDPHETNNLAEEEGQTTRVNSMLDEMQQWQQKVGDHQPLTSANPKPMFKDLTGTPRKADRWQPQWIVDKYFDPAEQ